MPRDPVTGCCRNLGKGYGHDFEGWSTLLSGFVGGSSASFHF